MDAAPPSRERGKLKEKMMEIKAVPLAKNLQKMDALAVGVFEGEDIRKSASGLLSAADKSGVHKALAAREHKGKKGEDVLVAAGAGGCGTVLVVGLGKRAAATAETLRRAASRIHAKAKAEKWSDVRVDYDSFALKGAGIYGAQALAEGALLSAYVFDKYKSEKKNAASKRPKAVEIMYKSAAKKEIEHAVAEAEALAAGVAIARTLGNEPANVLYPESYAARIKSIAVEHGLACRVFDEKKLATLKMGGILAVGMGSHRKPRLVIVEHHPKNAKNKQPIVLVGKGITFDTGGISIKPSAKMEEMKFDMCGSAAVVSAVATAARLKLPLYVVGLAPLAENMPGGGAQRPGDTITCYGGKTVDVLNTDAEGRLVLADALAYAETFKPKCVVDIATLTGLCAHFFDHLASGLMGTDADVVKRLKEAGEKTGERLWEVPLWEEYDEMIKGSYGDIQNVSRATAGTITAGMFLKHFAGHSPWAHLDVAGTAWGTTARGYNSVGATGVGVRLFTAFLKSYL